LQNYREAHLQLSWKTLRRKECMVLGLPWCTT
jgi:hypothetical protein